MHLDVSDPRSVDWITAGSGLVGVILGAVLSYLVTYQFERRRTREDRLAKSYSLMFAIMRAADDLTKLESEIETAVAKAKAAGAEHDVWTRLTFSVGYSNPITIPPEDLTIVALMRDQQLTVRVSEVESAHRVFLDSMQTYRKLQEKFERLSTPTATEGETVKVAVDHAQAAPTIIQLRSLSRSMCAGVPRAARNARHVASELGGRLKQHYKFKHFIELSYPRP